jgi:hypothetical protein
VAGRLVLKGGADGGSIAIGSVVNQAFEVAGELRKGGKGQTKSSALGKRRAGGSRAAGRRFSRDATAQRAAAVVSPPLRLPCQAKKIRRSRL